MEFCLHNYVHYTGCERHILFGNGANEYVNLMSDAYL